jgi:chemotaxis protein MotA
VDITTIVGIVLGLTAVVGGALLEGLHISAITQPTAAIIVLGGTIGATTLSFPLRVILGAGKACVKAFLEPKTKNASVIAEIIAYANKARKDGLISLETLIPTASDDFLKKAMSLAVDGTDPKVLKETMEIELNQQEEAGENEAKVFEAAGGFSPTIGIIGAVLGLIHVMQNLSDPGKLGEGIAVAFVATVYGVGTANLIYLPLASKMKMKHKMAMTAKEMMLEGVIGMLEGVNPRIIEEKLKGYLHESERTAAPGKGTGEKEKMAA